MKMRRQDKVISLKEALRILHEGEYGVLSTVGADGQPYGVPLNYVLLGDNRIFFHCAPIGHKLTNIRNNQKVSFCVVGRTKLLPAEFNTQFESVLVFGKASLAQGSERLEALQALIEKYSPEFQAEGKAYIEAMHHSTEIINIEITSISGKSNFQPIC